MERDEVVWPLSTLREVILSLPCRRQSRLVGIDGRGGSGKSTIGRALSALTDSSVVIEFDDFYRPSAQRGRLSEEGGGEIGGNFDWRRVRDQVLAPLAADQPARYQRYDWGGDRLAEWHEVQPGRVVIVEGNYTTRSELRHFYDFTIWVEAPHDVRLRRGIERGGHDQLARWLEEWIPEEERYIAAEEPEARVDLVLDGAPEPHLDPHRECKVLRRNS
jgi:uridine kinase